MKYKIIYISSLCMLMLVTGVFWGTWFTLTRSLETFSSDEFTHIGKVIVSNVAVPMSIILPLTILLTILSLVVYRKKRTIGFYLGLIAFLLIIAVLLITLVVLVPIDNLIKNWTLSTIPPDWQDLRTKWQTFHTLRTLGSILSFVFLSISLINDNYGADSVKTVN